MALEGEIQLLLLGTRDPPGQNLREGPASINKQISENVHYVGRLQNETLIERILLLLLLLLLLP